MTPITLINDDCLNYLPTLGAESIDLVVTDCPYKIVSGGCTTKGKSKMGGILSNGTNHTPAESGELFDYNSIKFSEWLPEIYRVLKNGTHCYIMINGRNLSELQREAEKVGFQFQNLLVWDKGNVTPNRYYMQAVEFILMLRKAPAKSITNMGFSNLLKVDNVRGKLHPTEKPIDLMKIMIYNSSVEGQVVLDPFMGAGSTGLAAISTNRKFIGVEIDPKYYEIAEHRINEALDEIEVEL